MKRFYKTVSIAQQPGGYALMLDGRPVKTPSRNALVLPGEAMVEAVAAEWDGQGEDIIVTSMPMTGFANAAIDRIVPDPDLFVREIAAFGESDTLCYRADPGDPLAERQDTVWEPILGWAEKRYDMRLVRVAGIIHQPQSEHSLSRLRHAVSALDPFILAPMVTMTSIGGSLVAALALYENAFDLETIWQAVCLEELWQESLWGVEAEAVRIREHRRAAFDDAHHFCCIATGTGRER